MIHTTLNDICNLEPDGNNHHSHNNSNTHALPQFSSIHQAIESIKPSIPMHCLNQAALKYNTDIFLKYFRGTTFYAVKTNPDPYVLNHLWENGIKHFDVASLAEVKIIHNLLPEAKMAFMHTVKGREAIRVSYKEYNVKIFAIDSIEELRKIQEETNNATDLTILVRISTPVGSACHSMIGKFGVSPDLAVDLLKESKKVSNRIGITFHVGSQTLDPTSFIAAMRLAKQYETDSGLKLDILDVGGGFPIPNLNNKIPPTISFLDRINQEILIYWHGREIWAEPGAGLSGTSSSVVVKVELRKGNLLYINDSAYGNLSDLCWHKRQNEVKMVRLGIQTNSDTLVPYEFFGATCDTPDRMPGPFMLPEDINEGDYIIISSLGAYGQTFRTHFNGFFDNIMVEIV